MTERERRVAHAGPPFRAIHDALVGVAIDWAPLAQVAARLDPAALARAQTIWGYRVQTEFRSIQVMARFLQEVLASGDPLEVFAGASDAVIDEVRHTALCVGVVEALGATALFPTPLAEDESPTFLALPMPQRALGTAVSMLAISETLSVALIEDLQKRATQATIRAVLDATLADEDAHRDFGWAYVAASLARFDADGRDFARAVAETTLAPHRVGIAAALDPLPMHQRTLAAWPEPELAALGLLGPEREALVKQDALERVLMPRLRSLGIA